MKKHICILYIVLFISFPVFAQQSVKEHYKAAQKFKKSEMYTLAAREMLEVSLLEPNKVDHHMELGSILRYGHAYNLAEQAYSNAIALDPQNADAYAERGYVRNWLHQYTNALQDLEKAMELKPYYKTYSHFQTYYLQKARDGIAAPKPLNRYEQLDQYSSMCFAAFLQGKLLPLSEAELYTLANTSHYNIYNRNGKSDQWTNYDRRKKFTAQDAEYNYLEAAPVILYLDKKLAGKPQQEQRDSVSRYVAKKVRQNFYTAAILVNHYQNKGIKVMDMLPRFMLSGDCLNALASVAGSVKPQGETPAQYRDFVYNVPDKYHPWEDDPRPKIVKLNPRTAPDAGCTVKKESIGFVYEVDYYGFARDKLYVMDFNCSSNKFHVLKIYGEPVGKLDLRKPTQFEWTSIPDLRAGYKNLGTFKGSYSICTKCEGRGQEEYLTGGGKTYTTVHTDHFNPQNNVVKESGTSAVKRQYRQCGTCVGNGFTVQF